MVTTKGFGMTNKGEQVTLYTIANEKASVSICDFGAKVVSFLVPDRYGNTTDIVLGYNDASGYDNDRGTYFGATIGRFGNRIKNARFSLNGVEYTLPINNAGKHCLHGGKEGFSYRMYEMEYGDNWVSGSILSPDMEEGFPGNMKFTVKYTLTDASLEIEYFAESDKDTLACFTNHSYFNLNGATSGKNILNHTLQIDADAYCVVDSNAMVTGLIRPVQNTVFDFTSPALLKDRLLSGDSDLIPTNDGIDNFFVCKNSRDEVTYNSSVCCDDNGIRLDCYTSELGVQIYTSAFIDTFGKGGTKYDKYAAICLETQGYPDAPNIRYVPSAILRAGEKFYSKTVYTASTF